MAIKEINRLRLERLAARFEAHRAPAEGGADLRARFEEQFVRARDEVLTPLLRDVGSELRKAGHDYVIEPDGDARRPSVLFRVALRGGRADHANTIGFFVQHDGLNGKSEVIPYLALRNEFDLGRFQSIDEMTRDVVEQMLVDAIEHLIVCNER